MTDSANNINYNYNMSSDQIGYCQDSLKSVDNDKGGIVRRIVCRYGRGCTHIQDPAHRERFWHPDQPTISEDVILSNHMCNECGMAFRNLSHLQLHLKRKTAWSNNSLVGCRISCLVDYKEWHEGFVAQFHKSGKHFVEFKLVNERRWLNMKKVAFYIVERPSLSNSSEFKSDDDAMDHQSEHQNLAPVEDWVYVEDISMEYAYAQSALFKIYGGNVQETGHKTKGHVVLTELDKERARNGHGSLLYGELLPRGANKAFSRSRLAVEDASCLFDLGMGTGKIIIQAYLQFRNLKYVYGVELSVGRYKLAEDAALRMVTLLGEENFLVTNNPGKRLIIEELSSKPIGSPSNSPRQRNNSSNSSKEDTSFFHAAAGISTSTSSKSSRVLHLECGDMFHVTNIDIADIVMLETDIPGELHSQLCRLLSLMHEGARTLTYLDLKKIWSPAAGGMWFKQLESNRFLSDRFPTSWSVQRGHHFFLWVRAAEGYSSPVAVSNASSTGEMVRNYSRSSLRADSPPYHTRASNPTSVDSNSSSKARGKSTIEIVSGSTGKQEKNKGSGRSEASLSRGGSCLPFTFDLLSFGFFSRWQKRREIRSIDRERSNTDERVVVPVNADGSRVSMDPYPLPPQQLLSVSTPSAPGSASVTGTGSAFYHNTANAHSSPAISMPSPANSHYADNGRHRHPDIRSSNQDQGGTDGIPSAFGVSSATVSFEAPSGKDKDTANISSSKKKSSPIGIVDHNRTPLSMSIPIPTPSPKSSERLTADGSPADGLFHLHNRNDLLTPSALYFDDPIELDTQATTPRTIRIGSNSGDASSSPSSSSAWMKPVDKYAAVRHTWISGDPESVDTSSSRLEPHVTRDNDVAVNSTHRGSSTMEAASDPSMNHGMEKSSCIIN